MTHLDKGNRNRFNEDFGVRLRLLRKQPHNLLCGHHHLIVLLLFFDTMGNGAGTPRICIGKLYN